MIYKLFEVFHNTVYWEQEPLILDKYKTSM